MGKLKVIGLLLVCILVGCTNGDIRLLSSGNYSGIEGDWVEVSDTSDLPISMKVTQDSVYVCCKGSGCLMSSDKIAFVHGNRIVLESGETIRIVVVGKDMVNAYMGQEKIGLRKVYCTEEEMRRNDAALLNVMREHYTRNYNQ